MGWSGKMLLSIWELFENASNFPFSQSPHFYTSRSSCQSTKVNFPQAPKVPSKAVAELENFATKLAEPDVLLQAYLL